MTYILSGRVAVGSDRLWNGTRFLNRFPRQSRAAVLDIMLFHLPARPSSSEISHMTVHEAR
jgi:hypothetical protein